MRGTETDETNEIDKETERDTEEVERQRQIKCEIEGWTKTERDKSRQSKLD